MPLYRLYSMNIRSGHIDHAQDIYAIDDQQALDMARAAEDHRPMELWFDSRKVHRFAAAVVLAARQPAASPSRMEGAAALATGASK